MIRLKQMIILISAFILTLPSFSCVNLSLSERLGYRFTVNSIEVTNVSDETDTLGNVVEIDTVQNFCVDTDEFEVFGADDGAVEFTIEALIDFPNVLSVQVTSLILTYEALDSVDIGDPTLIINLDPLVEEVENGVTLTIQDQGGTATSGFNVPVVPIRTKIEYLNKIVDQLGDSLSTGQGPYSFPRYQLNYIFTLEDSLGNQSFVEYSGVVVMGDYDHC